MKIRLKRRTFTPRNPIAKDMNRTIYRRARVVPPKKGKGCVYKRAEIKDAQTY